MTQTNLYLYFASGFFWGAFTVGLGAVIGLLIKHYLLEWRK